MVGVVFTRINATSKTPAKQGNPREMRKFFNLRALADYAISHVIQNSY
jgi:hypothetical protein